MTYKIGVCPFFKGVCQTKLCMLYDIMSEKCCIRIMAESLYEFVKQADDLDEMKSD